VRSIHTRLSKLELLRPVVRNCPGCGYPQRAVWRVITTFDAERLATCQSCGRALDADGMPLPNHFKHIIRVRRDASPAA
jgi:uncharacterized Zn finger protein